MGRFGFLIHPLNLEDVVKKYKLAKKLSPKVVASILRRRPPFVLGEIEGIQSSTGKRVTGFLVAVPLLPAQFDELPEEKVLKKLAKACKVAKKEGAQIVGLGAFTAIPGGGGVELQKLVNIPLTTGNTYTTTSAIEGTLRAAELMEIELKESTLAVVGSTGSIGYACAYLLAPSFKKTIVLGRDEKRLEAVADKLRSRGSKVLPSTDLSKVAEASVVVTATSAVKALIEPEALRPGAVVCDVARPRDVSAKVVRVRKDVLVIDGGIVKVPGLRTNFDMGLPPGYAFACLAETVILALEERFESYTLGKEISLEKVEEMRALADRHGFKVEALRSFERTLTLEHINEVKREAQAAKSLA